MLPSSNNSGNSGNSGTMKQLKDLEISGDSKQLRKRPNNSGIVGGRFRSFRSFL